MTDEQTAEAVEEPAADTTADNVSDIRDAGVDNEVAEPLGPPEWLPEKFWKDGAPNVEALAQSYKHLESKLGKQEPAPDEYAAPEGIDTADPIYTSFKDAAKQLGLNQQQHDALVQMYQGATPQAQEAQMKQWQAHLQEQYKMLGPDADKRIAGIEAWANNNLGQQDAKIIQDMMTSVDSVRVLERLVAASRDKRLPRRVEGLSQSMDADKLREMRYAKNDKGQLRVSLEPEYKRMVESAYAEYYGTEPAEQIVSGMR